jgi:hypothetical protein
MVVPAGPVRSEPARERVRIVTPGPESLHGDFPEKRVLALSLQVAVYDAKS